MIQLELTSPWAPLPTKQKKETFKMVHKPNKAIFGGLPQS